MASDRLVSKNRAAELFDVDRRRIDRALVGVDPEKVEGRSHLYSFATIGKALYGKGEGTQAQSTSLKDRKLRVEVLSAELDYEERLGNVADARGIESAAISEGRQVRDKLMRIPGRVALEFAAEDDEHKVKVRLETEIRNALEEAATDADG